MVDVNITYGVSPTSLVDALIAFAAFTPAKYLDHPYVLMAGVAWSIVGVGAMWAVFARDVRDTAIERIALAAISICSFSRAFFLLGRTEITYDAVGTAVSIAIYTIAIWYKHKYIYPQNRIGHPERRSRRKK